MGRKRSSKKIIKKYADNWPIFEKFLGYLRYIRVRKYIIELRNPICVDIGCGFDGRFLRLISKRIKCGFGYDLRANEADYGNIHVINNTKYDGRIPLKNNSVDLVLLLAVVEHLDMDSTLLEESFRILKRGGRIIITTPTPFAKPILEFLSFKLHLISEISIKEHKHYYSKRELMNIIKNHRCRCLKYSTFEMGCNELIVGEKYFE